MLFLFSGSGPGQAWLITLRSGFLQTVPRGSALAFGLHLCKCVKLTCRIDVQGTFTPLVHAHAGRTPWPEPAVKTRGACLSVPSESLLAGCFRTG
jgi:hypothetical protein